MRYVFNPLTLYILQLYSNLFPQHTPHLHSSFIQSIQSIPLIPSSPPNSIQRRLSNFRLIPTSNSSVPKALQEQLEHCIDVSTHDLLKDCDWKTNELIVEMINKNTTLIPFALKGIKNRLEHKKPHIRTLAVQLLHTLIDQCPRSRPFVSDHNFLKFISLTNYNVFNQTLVSTRYLNNTFNNFFSF